MNSTQFDRYSPEGDKFYNEVAQLKLDDLLPKSTSKPVISVMISTYNRKAQLSRSLETYARQEFRDFEILLNDDGSSQDIAGLVKQFEPYLNIQYFQTPRSNWVSCPSAAYAKMMPFAQGEIIVVAHPEMMLTHNALQFMYNILLKKKFDNCNTYLIDANPDAEISGVKWKWVSLRPNFFDEPTYAQINRVDWHKDTRNVERIPNWDSVGGFAGRTNIKHKFVPGYPWWFVGAALKDCPIWKDTPITKGHASIDMFWCYYRKKHHILDVVPDEVMCYHQPHQVSAVAPDNEMVNLFPPEEGAKCVYNW